MPVRALCMMPNYDFPRTPAAFYSSSGSKTSAGSEGFVAGIAIKSSVNQYCTVQISTRLKFTGTFQNYLQCVNRTILSIVRDFQTFDVYYRYDIIDLPSR